MQCSNLRSLTIQGDARPDPAARETFHHTPFLFFERLPERLSRHGDPPAIPHLEDVSMWWLQTKQDPPGCLEALRSLALALVGDRSRYSALKRLEIRRSVYPPKADGEPAPNLSEDMLREGLPSHPRSNKPLT